MEHIIEETSHYKLVMGKTVTSDAGHNCYQIVNKAYDMVEVETTLLPRALSSLSMIQKDLDNLVESATVTRH